MKRVIFIWLAIAAFLWLYATLYALAGAVTYIVRTHPWFRDGIYCPYGRILAHQGNSEQPFTYNGMWGVRQETNGLYQMSARYYDAVTGRFLSKEPIWPQITKPQALNPYQFAQSAPSNHFDPSGLNKDPKWNPHLRNRPIVLRPMVIAHSLRTNRQFYR
jgi:RHS repeat-associated protein